MEAYFGVLDEKTPLNIYDPGQLPALGDIVATENNNPLDQLQPTSVKPGNELDPRTIRVRKMLRAHRYAIDVPSCTMQWPSPAANHLFL
jgi:hypothetical protein